MPAVLAQPSSRENTSLAERFTEIRNTTIGITKGLTAEDQMVQSMPDASPTKWHLAHTTWFFETFILQPYGDGYKPFDPRFRQLFNSYYKQLGSHPLRGMRGLMSRPTLLQVEAYRAYVDNALLQVLEHAPAEVLGLVELGLHHEQQHQELVLTDIKHALWSNPLRPEPSTETSDHSAPPAMSWTEVEGGIYLIGHRGGGFAFDNEGPQHEVLVQPFRMASRDVTNGEYLEFIEDGGYRRPELWLSDGWDTIAAQEWNAPLYWEHHDGGWWQFVHGMRLQRVNPLEPVCHISYYEADAYARWRGARLPSEQEWEVAAARMPSNGTFLEDGVFHPQPARGEGAQQMFGDVWQWTASPYIAYPGFRPAKGFLGEYNGKFMCNQLVLRGGSCVTPRSHIRPTYRNFFPPHARWQFTGIRLAQ
ncbi:MAG TPA: ergothioneine biosynthesis protein EgtB [Terriglobales bacterium]|nr:ergothioneine biosynthesis protein EgtB [Terriglobales bacterium]